MEPQDPKHIEAALDDVDSDETSNLLSPEQAKELQQMKETADLIESQERIYSKGIENRARNLAQYSLSKVWERESQENSISEEESGKWDQFNNWFWYWVIRIFNLTDDDIHNANQGTRKQSILQPMALAVILILAVVGIFKIKNYSTISPDFVEVEAFKSQDIPKFIDLTTQVRVAMAPNAAFYQVSDTQIEMQWGDVWLDVQKGGKGFEVKTNYGTVTVTGTSFGVKQSDEGLIVEVSEGTVIYKSGDREIEIKEGTYIVADLFDVSNVTQREAKKDKPYWVQVMENDQWINSLTSLVAYWDFNELGVDDKLLRDSGPNGYHGDLDSENIPHLNDPSVSEELFGTSAYFDSDKKQFIRTKYISELGSMNQDFTFMAWVKRDKIQQWDRIFVSSAESTSWRFGFGQDKFGAGVGTGDSALIYNSPCDESLRDQWVHVAVSFEQYPSIFRFYCNGIVIGQFRSPKTAVNSGNEKESFIGRSVSWGNDDQETFNNSFSGNMDELRIYNEVLSDKSIRRISKIDFIERGVVVSEKE